MSFGASVAKYSRDKKASLVITATQALSELTEGIIEDTPIATGFLQANWEATVDAPSPSQPIKPEVPPMLARGRQFVRTKEAIFQAAIAARESVGKVFYFVNNVEYAYQAEALGWEDQSGNQTTPPYWMLKRNVKRFPRLLKKIAKRNRI